MKELVCDVVIGFSGLLIFLNWGGMISAIYSKKCYSFAPPFMAGLASMIAMLVQPNMQIRALSWIPLVLDPSIALAMSCIAFNYFRRKHQNK
ncbi:hypothetical protein [Solimicrobium silvestre]|uniref:Uncharacterized protein n=1 Tax=Solimicrobium silvestre TaxID=2099400 RepID=A0A2S9GVP5_9BURK|nr:hypothetical protein [Solimicrobium silvestre]PRC91726.1 hypothetical protein S2091_3481 [Solimicrobium silvestre]